MKDDKMVWISFENKTKNNLKEKRAFAGLFHRGRNRL